MKSRGQRISGLKKLVGTSAGAWCFAAAVAASTAQVKSDDSLFRKKLPRDDQVIHALNRLTFGPRPGDIEAVKKMGLGKWIDLQLHPERIGESQTLEEKLAPLDSLQLSAAEVVAAYPPPQLIRAVVLGRQNPPENPLARAAIERMAARLKITKEEAPDAPLESVRPLEELLAPDEIRALSNGTADQRREVLGAIPEDQIEQVIVAMPQPMRQQLIGAVGPALRRKLLIVSAPQQTRDSSRISSASSGRRWQVSTRTSAIAWPT
jgi:uncharacterized protein DUF1800